MTKPKIERVLEQEFRNYLKFLAIMENADRTYLFETVHTPEIFTNTYEWCADEITAQRDNLQDVKFEE